MAICRSCRGRFRSEQGVKAHMKWCDLYQTDKRKKLAALGRQPKAAATTAVPLPVQSIPPVMTPDLSARLREFEKAMSELSTKQYAPQTLQQQRRKIIQAAKAQIIDRDRASLGHITASLRGAAKMAIERELGSLPLEELPLEEVCELTTTIRDACYAPEFTRQARAAERKRVEEEIHQKKELEDLGVLLRTDRRKKIFIQQANHEAQAYCEEKAIIGWAQLSVVGDIESRLDAFLTGDEPILEAQAIVRSVVDARLAEAEATLAAARAKADEQWQEEVAAALVLGAVVGLVVLSLKYPAQTLAIFNWIERTFGYTPGADAGAPNSEAPKAAPPAPSAKARPRHTRWRKYPHTTSSPESPWENSVCGEPAHA